MGLIVGYCLFDFFFFFLLLRMYSASWISNKSLFINSGNFCHYVWYYVCLSSSLCRSPFKCLLILFHYVVWIFYSLVCILLLLFPLSVIWDSFFWPTYQLTGSPFSYIYPAVKSVQRVLNFKNFCLVLFLITDISFIRLLWNIRI